MPWCEAEGTGRPEEQARTAEAEGEGTTWPYRDDARSMMVKLAEAERALAWDFSLELKDSDSTRPAYRICSRMGAVWWLRGSG